MFSNIDPSRPRLTTGLTTGQRQVAHFRTPPTTGRRDLSRPLGCLPARWPFLSVCLSAVRLLRVVVPASPCSSDGFTDVLGDLQALLQSAVGEVVGEVFEAEVFWSFKWWMGEVQLVLAELDVGHHGVSRRFPCRVCDRILGVTAYRAYTFSSLVYGCLRRVTSAHQGCAGCTPVYEAASKQGYELLHALAAQTVLGHQVSRVDVAVDFAKVHAS